MDADIPNIRVIYENIKYKKRNNIELDPIEIDFLEILNTVITIQEYIITYYKQEMEGDICIDRILEEIKKIEI